MKPIKKAADMNTIELASYIDQSVLKPEFSEEEIRKYIQEGVDYNCKTVCINPSSLPIAREICKGTNTGICVVCDFPFGCSSTESKVQQAEIICKDNNIEDLDLVSNYGWIKSGKWNLYQKDIEAVVEVVHKHDTKLKVILETDALTLEEISIATDIACKANVDFVKTSTGFFNGAEVKGATTEIIQCIIDAAKGRCKVKASAGIRDREKFLAFIDQGIDRMGIGYRSTPIILGIKK